MTPEKPLDDAAGAQTTQRPEADNATPWRLKRSPDGPKLLSRGTVLTALLALSLAASVGSATVMYYFHYRPDRATDAAAAQSAIDAAKDGSVAALSYAPGTLDRDFSSAKSHLTGDFLSYYSKFTEQVVAPAVKQKSVKTSAVVLRAAVAELHPGSAVVLVYVNQSTASKDRPEPTMTSSSVLVTLTKVDAKWLISQFNPI
jgi:Mce-associated membrane protein